MNQIVGCNATRELARIRKSHSLNILSITYNIRTSVIVDFYGWWIYGWFFAEQEAAWTTRPAETAAAADLRAAGWCRCHQWQVSWHITAPHGTVSHSQYTGGEHKWVNKTCWQIEMFLFHTVWFVISFHWASPCFLCDTIVQTELWNVTPSPWALCSWSMWI